jgi:antitoxin ParD1/3/4
MNADERRWIGRLEERERRREAALEAVKQKIALGLEQAKRGQLLDGEEVFRELEKRSG